MYLVRMGEKFEGWAKRNIPDPLSIALFLTVFMALFALFATDSSIDGIASAWTRGFWGFLSFSMQVCLSMVAGAVIFNAPIIKNSLAKLCSIPKTSRQAGIFLYVMVYILIWMNWGIGYISIAFLTREVARQFNAKSIPYHLPFLAAAASAGHIAYGFGWNSACLIMIGQPGNFAEEAMGLIPLATAIFSRINIIALIGLFVVGIIVFYFLHPFDKSKFVQSDFDDIVEKTDSENQLKLPMTFAEKFDNFWYWNIPLLFLWAVWFYNLMKDVGLNAINLDVANITASSRYYGLQSRSRIHSDYVFVYCYWFGRFWFTAEVINPNFQA